MAKLEDQIVNALCQQQADDCVTMMHDAAYQVALKDFFQEMIKILLQSLPAEFTEEMKAEIVAKLTPEAFLANILKDDTKMREDALKNAWNQFMRSKSDMEKALPLRQQVVAIRKESPEAAAKLDTMIDTLMARMESTWKFNAAIVNDLAKIAKKSGLEKAVNPESVSAVFRKYLPTKEEYMAHYGAEGKKLRDGLAEFFDALKQTLAGLVGQDTVAATKDKEFDEASMELDLYQKILGTLGKSMVDRLQKDFTGFGVNRIYGK